MDKLPSGTIDMSHLQIGQFGESSLGQVQMRSLATGAFILDWYSYTLSLVIDANAYIAGAELVLVRIRVGEELVANGH